MSAAQIIRQAVTDVSLLREACERQPELGSAVATIKRLQARRFAGTYADLLATSEYAPAARFFLEELYNDRDYAERDGQFARIAGAIETFFPTDVAKSAMSLAQLHSLTEQLDLAMGRAWMEPQLSGLTDGARYTEAWRHVGRRPDRQAQLEAVLAIGHEMAHLTRMPGLRLMLKMMRGPASAAGLSSLQRFLEKGFDTFAGMAKRPRGAEIFLETIRQREQALIGMLFDAELVACQTELDRTLGQAR